MLASLLVFVALAAFGARVHWVEEAGSAERDGFVAQAEVILGGHLPVDPYRPLLYPLLTAAVAQVLGDAFTAARLLSNVAAAVVVWLAFAFGCRLGSVRAGWFALGLSAVNPNLWILGQHATTDFLFAALAGATVLCGLIYLEGLRPADDGRTLRLALLTGVFLGFAAFTRANALFLLPGLMLAWWWAPGPPARRLRDLGAAALATTTTLVPHWWLRAVVFGHPLYDENWKNLAFKLYGYPDWSYLERVPFSGPVDLLRSDPAAIVRAGGVELERFAVGGASQLLGTVVHVALSLLAVVVLLRRAPKRTGYLLITGGVFVLAVAFTFFTWGRLLLWLLPVANALLAAGLLYAGAWVDRLLGGDRRRWVLGAQWLLMAAVAVLAIKTFFFRLPAFVERHPYEEVAKLRQLELQVAPDAVLGGTSPCLGRYLKSPDRYVYVPDAFGDEVSSEALYYKTLERLVREQTIEYLVAGATDRRSRPRSLVGVQPPVGWLRSLGCGMSVCVWQVVTDATEPGGEGEPGGPRID